MQYACYTLLLLSIFCIEVNLQYAFIKHTDSVVVFIYI